MSLHLPQQGVNSWKHQSLLSPFQENSGSGMEKILRELADRDQHNLKLQFKVGLGNILFCFCLFTATIIYHFQRSLLEEVAFHQT